MQRILLFEYSDSTKFNEIHYFDSRRITKILYLMRKIAENQTFSAIFIFGKTPKIGKSE